MQATSVYPSGAATQARMSILGVKVVYPVIKEEEQLFSHHFTPLYYRNLPPNCEQSKKGP